MKVTLLSGGRETATTIGNGDCVFNAIMRLVAMETTARDAYYNLLEANGNVRVIRIMWGKSLVYGYGVVIIG